MNSMCPEEVVPYFYPQIYNVADHQLSDEEFPQVSRLDSLPFFKPFSILNLYSSSCYTQLEMLERATLVTEGIFLCYNALSVYLFVGS